MRMSRSTRSIRACASARSAAAPSETHEGSCPSVLMRSLNIAPRCASSSTMSTFAARIAGLSVVIGSNDSSYVAPPEPHILCQRRRAPAAWKRSCSLLLRRAHAGAISGAALTWCTCTRRGALGRALACRPRPRLCSPQGGVGMADTATGVTITPIHPCLGARVTGLDLAAPLDEASFRRIFDAFQEHSVLVFHDQRLRDEPQMAFSRRFGPLEETIKATGRENRLHPNLVDLSNTDPDHDGRLMDWTDRRMLYQSGNQLWHTDSSFKPVPAMASLLSGREVPPVGGETEFVSMRHAYRTLPEATRRGLEGKVVVHSILYSRSTIAKGLFDPEHEKGLPA